MELRQLHYFVAVAEECHFGRAAARVGIEQSPLSRAIQSLEREVGVKLLKRSSRGTCMTPPGETFLAQARLAITFAERACETARNVATKGRDILRIGLHEPVNPCVSQLIKKLGNLRPAVRVHATTVSKAEDALRRGQVDIAFSVYRDRVDGIVANRFLTEPLMILTPADHPLACERTVALSNIVDAGGWHSDLDLAALSAAHSTRHWKMLFNNGSTPNPVVSLTGLLALIEAGVATGITTSSHAGLATSTGIVVRPMSDARLTVTTYLLRRDEPESPELTSLLQIAARFSLAAWARSQSTSSSSLSIGNLGLDR